MNTRKVKIDNDVYRLTAYHSIIFSLCRHCLVSAGPMLTEHMWHQACHSLQHACRVTLHSLQQLMAPFKPESDNFYGDIGLVRVAVRKDCSSIECERLRQLAQQVSLMAL